jgi:hypothetical protein
MPWRFHLIVTLLMICITPKGIVVSMLSRFVLILLLSAHLARGVWGGLHGPSKDKSCIFVC